MRVSTKSVGGSFCNPWFGEQRYSVPIQKTLMCSRTCLHVGNIGLIAGCCCGTKVQIVL